MINKHFWIGAGIVFLGMGSALSVRSQPAPAELSFTAAQVSNGEAEYKTSCVDCHGPHLDDGEFGGPPLKGAPFTAKWFKSPPSALVNYVHAAMPPDTPGRLPMGTYVEIIAYILSVNGLQAGTTEMPADVKALSALHYPLPKNGAGQ